jgi:hypothetical protein
MVLARSAAPASSTVVDYLRHVFLLYPYVEFFSVGLLSISFC